MFYKRYDFDNWLQDFHFQLLLLCVLMELKKKIRELEEETNASHV